MMKYIKIIGTGKYLPSKKVENMEEKVLAVASINALIQYIEETQKTSLDHINKITLKLLFLKETKI